MRREFAANMKFVGQLRKKAQTREEFGPPTKNWEWLVFRKIRGRQFHDQQVLLEWIRRTREAERF